MQFSRLFEHIEDELEPIGIIVSCSCVGNRGGGKVINDLWVYSVLGIPHLVV